MYNITSVLETIVPTFQEPPCLMSGTLGISAKSQSLSQSTAAFVFAGSRCMLVRRTCRRYGQVSYKRSIIGQSRSEISRIPCRKSGVGRTITYPASDARRAILSHQHEDARSPGTSWKYVSRPSLCGGRQQVGRRKPGRHMLIALFSRLGVWKIVMLLKTFWLGRGSMKKGYRLW